MKLGKFILLGISIITIILSLSAKFLGEQKSITASSDTIKTTFTVDTTHVTPNIEDYENKIEGIVLHHTACPTLENALYKLSTVKGGVSCHVLIDRDGTRYVLAPPTAVTWHAGKSYFNGKEHCNDFMIGIELHGNTCARPLTDEQIHSAIEYIIPLMKKYNIPITNIVTHSLVRKNYIKLHPEEHVPDKVDITDKEYARFIDSLKVSLSAM